MAQLDSSVSNEVLFSDIVGMSETMLGLAKEGRWDEVRTLQADRQVMLESFFEGRATTLDADHIARSIQEVLNFDRELMLIGQKTQKEIGQHIRKIGKGQKGVSAYQRHHSA